MQHRMTLEYDIFNNHNFDSSENSPLKINVYTSEYCSFCSKALTIAHSAAERFSSLGKQIEVVETPIDDRPSLIEELDIMALPMIRIGHLRIIGLPAAEDIERIVHEVILMSD
jgi:hypothetical protein